jgi:hypothetical protein
MSDEENREQMQKQVSNTTHPPISLKHQDIITAQARFKVMIGCNFELN